MKDEKEMRQESQTEEKTGRKGEAAKTENTEDRQGYSTEHISDMVEEIFGEVQRGEDEEDGYAGDDDEAGKDEHAGEGVEAGEDEPVEEDEYAGDDEAGKDEYAGESVDAGEDEPVEEDEYAGDDEVGKDEHAGEGVDAGEDEPVEEDEYAGDDEAGEDEYGEEEHEEEYDDEYEEETERKPKKKKKRRRRVARWKKLLLTLEFLILAAIILAAVWLVQSGIFEVSDVVFGELTVEEIYYVAGQDENVTFTVQARNSELEMQLCDAEEVAVGTMHDDGQNGDETAGDGIYTCTLAIADAEAGAQTYHVKEAKTSSNEVTIYIFRTLSEEELESANEVCDEVWNGLREIEAEYAGASGYVTVDDFADIFADVEVYLKSLVAEGTVIRYIVEDESAYIKFASGLSLCYEPILEDTFSGEDDIQLTVAYFHPAEGNYAADCEETLDGAMAQIENLENGETYEGSEVSLSTVKSLASDQVIVWYGHGSYSSVTGSALVLDATVGNFPENMSEDSAESQETEDSAESQETEDTAESQETEDAAESQDEEDSTQSRNMEGISESLTSEDQADLFKDRLTTVYQEDGEQHLAVTAAYIETYCGDLSNDLIFISACDGGKDSRLGDAFLACGATAVLCFSDSVLCEYASGVIDLVLQYMMRAWPESEWFYTLEQALDRVKNVLGKNDAVWFETYTDMIEELRDTVVPCGAEPILLLQADNSGIRLSTEKGSLSGTVYYYLETPEPAGGATVTIRQEGELFAELVTDENGEYAVGALPVGTYDITFSLTGYGDYYLENVVVSRDKSTGADGYFFTNTGITGTVIDAFTGEALAAVEVELLIGDGNTIYKQTVLTDENGDYTFDLTQDSKSAALSELVKYFESSNYSDLLEGSALMTEKQLSPEGLSGYTMGIAGSGVLLFEKDGYVSGEVDITVTGFDSPYAGVTELTPQVEIGGYVYDANGNALGGVTISAVVTDDGSAEEQEETDDPEEEGDGENPDSEDENGETAEGTSDDGADNGSSTLDGSDSTVNSDGTGTDETANSGGAGAKGTANSNAIAAANRRGTVSTAATGDTDETATDVFGYYSLNFEMGAKLTIRVTYSLSGYDTKTVDYVIDSSMIVDGKVQLTGVYLSRTRQVEEETTEAVSEEETTGAAGEDETTDAASEEETTGAASEEQTTRAANEE